MSRTDWLALAEAELASPRRRPANQAVVVMLTDGIQTGATGSNHYIQFSQPDLVVAATELVLRRLPGQ